jgi:hypothetical protein
VPASASENLIDHLVRAHYRRQLEPRTAGRLRRSALGLFPDPVGGISPASHVEFAGGLRLRRHEAALQSCLLRAKHSDPLVRHRVREAGRQNESALDVSAAQVYKLPCSLRLARKFPVHCVWRRP